MRKTISAVLAVCLAVGALAGCAEESSSSETVKQTKAADAKSAVLTAVAAEDFDFMEFHYAGSGEDMLGKSVDELNSATGNKFTEDTAKEYDLKYGCVYDLGTVDSISAGRISLGAKYPCTLNLNFNDDGKLVKISYYIEKGDTEAKTVSDVLIKSLEDNLPEGYEGEYEPRALGKDSAWFGKDVDGYVYTVKHFDPDDSGYPVVFIIETYKDKYGL